MANGSAASHTGLVIAATDSRKAKARARAFAVRVTLVVASGLALCARATDTGATDVRIADSTQLVQPLVERFLYSMPVGEDSSHCIRLPETECCTDREAGIGAVASNGEIWWYDHGNRNIKVFSDTGTRVVRGFSGHGAPTDMAVNSAAIYLLFDRFLDPMRFVIFARAHNDTTWRAVPFFYGPDGLPPDSIPVTVRNSSGGDVGQLYAYSDEMVYFYQRLAHESYPLARGDSIFSPSDQARLGFEGFPGPNGRKYLSYGSILYISGNGAEEEVPISGAFIGVDDAAHLYFMRFARGGPVLELRTREQLMAAGVWVRRGNWGGSGAKHNMHVRQQGGLVEFQPTAERLIINLWEPLAN